jgi:hypothetical protein
MALFPGVTEESMRIVVRCISSKQLKGMVLLVEVKPLHYQFHVLAVSVPKPLRISSNDLSLRCQMSCLLVSRLEEALHCSSRL